MLVENRAKQLSEQYTAMLDENLNAQGGERYRKFIRSLLHDCCKLQEAEYH